MLTFYIRFLGYLNIDIKDDVDWDPFQLMEEEFMVEKTYMVLRKNSVLKDSLDIMIGRCFDTGLTLFSEIPQKKLETISLAFPHINR